MTDPVPDHVAEETARLLAEFIERERSSAGGETVDFETFCTEHPDQADRLRALRAETPPPDGLPGGAPPDPSDPALEAHTILQEPTASETRAKESATSETLSRGPAPTVAVPGLGDGVDATIVHSDEEPGHTVAKPEPAPEAPKNPFGLPTIPDVSLEREIGRGGMGVVYVGSQTYLERVVAVKVLKAEGKDFADRFKREAKILASLSHPHIVGCYQAGALKDGQCYLVMEYIDGPNLHQFLAKNGAAPLDRALEICAHVAEALDCAHQQTIIHRDVKPANVLLQRVTGETSFPYVPKLADLGLARPTSTDSTQFDLTVKGAVMGSPPTMAPEQFDDPQSVDYLADIYGLGCVLFHMVTGRTAYPQTTLTATITSKMRDESPDPRELVEDLPEDIAEFIQSMIARDRKERPQSYVEIAARCRELAQAKPKAGSGRKGAKSRSKTKPKAAPAGTRAAQSTEPKSKLGLYGGVAVGVLAVGAAALWGPFFDPEPEPNPGGEQVGVEGPDTGASRDGDRLELAESDGSGAAESPGSNETSDVEPAEEAWSGSDQRFAVDTDHRATVTQLLADGVLVELEDGLIGRIATEDLSWIPNRAPAEVVAVGDRMDVRVLGVDRVGRELTLGAKQREISPWERLSPGDEVEVVVRAVDQGGADVQLESGLTARLSAAELSWTEAVADATEVLTVDDRLTVVVAEVLPAAGTIVVSRRASEPNPWDALAESQRRTGTVESVTTDHATLLFPDGLRGRLDAHEWSWNGTPSDLAAEVNRGQEIEVVVLDHSAEDFALWVGHKQLASDPWRELEIGATVRGTVRNHWSDGAAVELENGLMGEIAVREMSWTAREPAPADYVQTDTEVECQIVGIDRQERRVELSLRALTPNPWEAVSERFPIGRELSGTLTEFAPAPEDLTSDFPAGVWYAQLEDGFEGALVQTYVGSQPRASERTDAQEGATVDLRITRVDRVGRTIEVALLLPEVQVEPAKPTWPMSPALAVGETRSLIGRDPEKPLAAWRSDGHELSTATLALDVEGRVAARGHLDKSGSALQIEPFEASIEMPAEDWQLDLGFGVSMPDNRYWEDTFVVLYLDDGRRLELRQYGEAGAVVATRSWRAAGDEAAVQRIGAVERGHLYADYMAAPAPRIVVRQQGAQCSVSLYWMGEVRTLSEPGARVVRLGIGMHGPRSFFDRLELSRP